VSDLPPNYAGLGQGDFAAALGNGLLPRGLAWTRLAGSVLQNFWNAIAGAFAALHARVGALTELEAFPPTSVELLPDWERVLGLPDPCLGANPVVAARQAAVLARLAASGGQSIPYFQQLALNLGSTITVTEYAPFRWGIDHWGAPLRCQAWAYIWQVTISGGVEYRFQWGRDQWGSPLWSFAGGAVECEILRLKPAHTLVEFVGGGDFIVDLTPMC
jgi:uncharacterized protein YmfQ (DUF2313 family)